MTRPFIGITTRSSTDADNRRTIVLQQAYINAIERAGGIAMPLPSQAPSESRLGLYSRLDAILFSGGGDIALDHFPGTPHARISGIDAARDESELAWLKAAASDGKPVLGICRGAQVMNVAMGGSLYTHIPDQLPGALDHDYPGALRTAIVHPVNVDETARAAEVFGETQLQVNSLHHQGLKDIGTGLRAAGRAPDGLVEVVELIDHPFAIAVQWHPEWLTDQEAMLRLFRAFVQAGEEWNRRHP